MAFPEDSLSDGEEVRLHLRPHAISLFWPLFWTIVTFGGAGAAAYFWLIKPDEPKTVWFGIAGVSALVLFIWFALAPYIVWRSTHYVFTTKQVLIRKGVFRREDRGIPLNKVNDVHTTQGVLDRILRSGTLLIESAGEQGQSRLAKVPGAVKVANTLKQLVEHDLDKHQLDQEEMREILREHRAEGGAL